MAITDDGDERTGTTKLTRSRSSSLTVAGMPTQTLNLHPDPEPAQSPESTPSKPSPRDHPPPSPTIEKSHNESDLHHGLDEVNELPPACPGVRGPPSCFSKDTPTGCTNDSEKKLRGGLQREGLGDGPIYVGWDSEDDPQNPMNWPRSRKWLMSAVGMLFCGLVSMSVSGYAIGQPSEIRDLGTSQELSALGITMFTITFGAAPLLLAPLSEVFGRTPIYIASAFVFFICFIPQALSKSLAVVLVFRFISGIGGSTAVALVGGTLADVWSREDRGLPMALFAWSAFASTGLGPVAFGFVQVPSLLPQSETLHIPNPSNRGKEKKEGRLIKILCLSGKFREMNLGWRYINWILLAVSGTFTVIISLVCKETRASVLLSRKAARLRKETGDPRYVAQADEERGSIILMARTSLSRPLYLLFTEPVLAAFAIWIAFAWGVLYIFLESLPLALTEVYNFDSGSSGLAFLSQFIGACIGLGINEWSDRLFRKNVARKGCEARLYIAMVAGLLFPIGEIFYTWTLFTSIHWIVPLIGVTILYAGMYGIYISCFNYLSDAYTLYASSALSAQSFVRNLFGAASPLFAVQMYRGMGLHWAGTLLSCIAFALAVIPFILYRYGSVIRSKSKFAVQLARLEEERTRTSDAERRKEETEVV